MAEPYYYLHLSKNENYECSSNLQTFVRYILLLECTVLLVVCEISSLDCNEIITPLGFVCICNASYCDTVPTIKPIKNSFYHIITGRNFSGFNVNIVTFPENLLLESAKRFVITFHNKKQSLLGFGGSFTDAFGINVLSLTLEAQDKLLSSYFSPEGIRYSLCRVPMGACDFSLRYYSYDDVINDIQLNNFHLQPEDYAYKIELIKRIHKISPAEIKLITSNWSPPAWMKKRNSTESSYVKEEYYQLYADYQIRFLEKYKQNGIIFWGITPVNEPLTGMALHVPLNNIIMFPEQQRKWIAENLGPTLMKNGFNDTKVIVLDDQRKYIIWWMDIMMEYQVAAKHVAGIGLHWYFDHITSPKMMDAFHANYPDKLILYTESSVNGMFGKDLLPSLGIWERGALYAQSIIEALNHWSSGWIDWNMALDLNGGPNLIGLNCDAPILVNKTADEFYKQPMYYVLGHFSAFSQPGSFVVSILDESTLHKKKKRETPPFPDPLDPVPSKAEEDIHLTATINPDGSKSVFILNGYSSPKNISIQLKLLPEHLPIYLNLSIAAESLNTLIFWE